MEAVEKLPLSHPWTEVGNLPLTCGKKSASFCGRFERVYRTVKTALKSNDNWSAWYENLGLVLLGARSMVKENIGCSSS